ncbi:MAG: hypothetical protein J1E82_08525 [Muribaculaceae bacterium]|nr:hypothetical protein [Muribaculaceae bacterium]
MKHIQKIAAVLAFGGLFGACTDDPLVQTNPSEKDTNIEAFKDGYSICFDVTLDQFGGGMNTRATSDDAMLEEWENYLNPEEFRILFFDKDDNFLFESKTRWFSKTDAGNGNVAWRVGVPIFSYLSDEFVDNNDASSSGQAAEADYNWNRIAEIMRTERFKIAILANRPKIVEVPKISDYNKKYEPFIKDFADNGPFWNATNSIASYDLTNDEDKALAEEKVRKTFDLHHCQFDPLYLSKSDSNGGGWYDFIMDYGQETRDNVDLPFMGAMSSWLSIKRERMVYNPQNPEPDEDNLRYIRYYRLPIDRFRPEDHDMNNEKDVVINGKNIPRADETGVLETDKEQYIPMYGIQQFDPLTAWSKGTTFNVSTQTASQTGEYHYKSIFLLRSVVKLELRIPMYDNAGNYVDVDNKWAQIMLNNYMARCEPMDVSTPTDQIWEADHGNNCEWNRIRDYGLLCTGNANDKFKQRLSWFYGIWHKQDFWNLYEHGLDPVDEEIPQDYDFPQIFNPLTQRLQYSFITDCYLPIENVDKKQCFHRWVLYCGERNMNDLNTLGQMNSHGFVSCFRIKVTRKVNNQDKSYIYYLPLTDYTGNNPIKNHMIKEVIDNPTTEQQITDTYIKAVRKVNTSWQNEYCNGTVRDGKIDKKYYPFPLIRNHFYRLTVSFGNDTKDINVQVMDSERRSVGGIVFN